MNYYDVLRINKDASQQEIKDAYKKLIKRYHPDVYPGNKVRAEHITRDLNEAYDILSDSEKKAIYDLSIQPSPINIEPDIPTKYEPSVNYKEDFENSFSPTWDQKLKENIHTFVDNKTQNLSQNEKLKIISIIILIALIILLLTIKDYYEFQISLNEKENSQNVQDILQFEDFEGFEEFEEFEIIEQ